MTNKYLATNPKRENTKIRDAQIGEVQYQFGEGGGRNKGSNVIRNAKEFSEHYIKRVHYWPFHMKARHLHIYCRSRTVCCPLMRPPTPLPVKNFISRKAAGNIFEEKVK